jgi:ADP-ribose pyrophosphatase YjhB (NUDIX family)
VNTSYSRFNNIYSVIAVVTPEGIPLVKDLNKAPAYWKFPGGHGEASESAVDCAWRELLQETGIDADFFEFEKLHEEQKADHKLVFFMVKRAKAPKIKLFGEEGEQVDYFPLEKILALPDFFPNHFPLLEILRTKI